jgi:predicted DNA-binding transcriptional regulator AlpA
VSGETEVFVTVSIDTWGGGLVSYEEEAVFDLAPMLSELGASGPVASAGGLSGGPSATFSLVSPPGLAMADVARAAVEMFETACAKVGLEHRGIARVDALDDRLLDLELTQDPESYVGVTEVAKLLGVSRQRVAELRHRTDFPEPIVELAAGPVWTRTSLEHFVASWPRRPGRPRKTA